jgi:anti-sigma B factor antagonist
MPFGMRAQQHGDLTVLRLSGELDLQPAADLTALLDTLVQSRHSKVLVDLRLLTFCDSVGLSALIHGYRACQNAGGTLRITGDTGLVSRLLTMTGVRELLTAVPEGTQTDHGHGR